MEYTITDLESRINDIIIKETEQAKKFVERGIKESSFYGYKKKWLENEKAIRIEKILFHTDRNSVAFDLMQMCEKYRFEPNENNMKFAKFVASKLASKIFIWEFEEDEIIEVLRNFAVMDLLNENLGERNVTSDDKHEQPEQIEIPKIALQWLQNNEYIENATATPIKLKKKMNKQLLREFLTYEKIKGSFTIADVEREVPKMFVDRKGIPYKLTQPRKNSQSNNVRSKQIREFLATL